MTPAGVKGLSLVTRPDHTRQVSYKGAPLYTFTGDKRAGDTKGNGFKDVGVWRPVTVSGTSAAPSQPVGRVRVRLLRAVSAHARSRRARGRRRGARPAGRAVRRRARQPLVDLTVVRRISPDDAELLRVVRLRALETDPLSFGSTYEREAAYPDERWREWAEARAPTTTRPRSSRCAATSRSAWSWACATTTIRRRSTSSRCGSRPRLAARGSVAGCSTRSRPGSAPSAGARSVCR